MRHELEADDFAAPFTSEADFKRRFCRMLRRKDGSPPDVFCVETEETEPGFPDVLVVWGGSHVELYELKVTDGRGRFIMQPTQPRFYAAHPRLNIKVAVGDRRDKARGRVWVIDAADVAARAKEVAGLTYNLEDFVCGKDSVL